MPLPLRSAIRSETRTASPHRLQQFRDKALEERHHDLLFRAADQAHLGLQWGSSAPVLEWTYRLWDAKSDGSLCLQNLQVTLKWKKLRKAPPDRFSADSARSTRSACCWWHLNTIAPNSAVVKNMQNLTVCLKMAYTPGGKMTENDVESVQNMRWRIFWGGTHSKWTAPNCPELVSPFDAQIPDFQTPSCHRGPGVSSNPGFHMLEMC